MTHAIRKTAGGFPLGRIMATPGVLAALNATAQKPGELGKALDRHASGDWGDIHPEDVGMNERAIANGDRLLSVYTIDGVKVWIITEADRSSTTVLLPEEY